MTYYKIGDNIYPLPLGDLYIEEFNNYQEENIISFANVTDINEKYHLLNSLFGWIARSLCSLEDEYLPPTLYEEKQGIRRRMDNVDWFQRHYFKKGEVASSISIIEKFIEVMLVHHKKAMDSDNPRLEI